MRDKCIICGEYNLKVMGTPRQNRRFPRDCSSYRILQCNSCRHFFVSPSLDLSREEWGTLYTDNYFSSKSQWLRSFQEKERKQRIDLIKRNIRIVPTRFLDLGCGEGLVLQSAIQEGWEAHGLDICNNLRLDETEINYYLGELTEASYPNESFDIVFMDSVLEHTLDPLGMLSEIYRITRPGGALFLVVPNELSFVNRFKKLAFSIAGRRESYGEIKPFVTPYHIQGFNKRSLKVALQKTGFKELQVSDFGGNYTLWKNYPFFSMPYLKSLALLPANFISVILGQQIQLQALATK